jgi:hypothetical protein
MDSDRSSAPDGATFARELTARHTPDPLPPDLRLELAVLALPLEVEFSAVARQAERFGDELREMAPRFSELSSDERQALRRYTNARNCHLRQARADAEDPAALRHHLRCARYYTMRCRAVFGVLKARVDPHFRQELRRFKSPLSLRELLGGTGRAAARRPGRAGIQTSPSPARMSGARANRRSDTSASSPPGEDPPDEDPEPSRAAFADGRDTRADAAELFADALGVPQ